MNPTPRKQLTPLLSHTHSHTLSHPRRGLSPPSPGFGFPTNTPGIQATPATPLSPSPSHTARVEDRSSGYVPSAADGTNVIPPTDADAIWYRIVSDGTDVYVYAAANEANLDSRQSANTWCMRTTATTDQFAFADGHGQLGFMGGSSTIYLDNITIKTDPDNDADVTLSSTFETVEIEDDFTLVGGKLVDSPTYDDAGNMTFDGAQRYEYNASNQLVAVYNQGVNAAPGNPATPGSLIATYRYGPTGRRIAKDIYTADGQDDAQHFYYHDYSVIETRNGSNLNPTQTIDSSKIRNQFSRFPFLRPTSRGIIPLEISIPQNVLAKIPENPNSNPGDGVLSPFLGLLAVKLTAF